MSSKHHAGKYQREREREREREKEREWWPGFYSLFLQHGQFVFGCAMHTGGVILHNCLITNLKYRLSKLTLCVLLYFKAHFHTCKEGYERFELKFYFG